MVGLVRGLSTWAAAVALVVPGNGTPLGKVTLSPGPAVPVVVQRSGSVLLPGSKQIRLAVSRNYGACETFLSTSPDGRWLAWTAPAGGLRLIDLRTRSSYSLGAGCDPTWGPDDRLAYLRATTISLTQATYRSVIIVRRTPLAAGKVWAHGQLWGIAWAADRLVYNETRRTYPLRQLHITSGPGSVRTVPASALGHNDPLLVAASPYGSRLLVQVDRTVTAHGSTSLRTYEDLVDADTGAVLSEVAARGVQGLGSGVWLGDRVVAAQGADQSSAHPQPELIRLSTAGDRLRVDEVRNLDPTSDGLFDWLADLRDTGHGTIAVTRHRRTSTLLSCQVTTLRCTKLLDLD